MITEYTEGYHPKPYTAPAKIWTPNSRTTIARKRVLAIRAKTKPLQNEAHEGLLFAGHVTNEAHRTSFHGGCLG